MHDRQSGLSSRTVQVKVYTFLPLRSLELHVLMTSVFNTTTDLAKSLIRFLFAILLP